jgi:S1-C subfamily serine protease
MSCNQWIATLRSSVNLRRCVLLTLVGFGVWTAQLLAQNTPQAQNTPPEGQRADDGAIPADDVPPPALGVQISDRSDGVFIADVHPGSPAGKAGIKRGDQIISIDGKRVTTPHEMIMAIQKQRKVEEQAKVEVRRDGKDTVHELSLMSIRPGRVAMYGARDNRGWLGVILDTPEEQAAQTGTPAGQRPQGVIVKKVYPKGPAEKAGLRAGDMITSINNQNIKTPEDLISVMGPMQAKAPVDIVATRGGQRVAAKVVLGGRTDFADLAADHVAEGDDLPPFAGIDDPYAGDDAHDQALMHRHLAEQHQRIENQIQELTGEIRALRAEVAALRGKAPPAPVNAGTNSSN